MVQWTCDCGNRADLDGFTPCTAGGYELPWRKDGWVGDYVKCVDCGAVTTMDELDGSE